MGKSPLPPPYPHMIGEIPYRCRPLTDCADAKDPLSEQHPLPLPQLQPEWSTVTPCYQPPAGRYLDCRGDGCCCLCQREFHGELAVTENPAATASWIVAVSTTRWSSPGYESGLELPGEVGRMAWRRTRMVSWKGMRRPAHVGIRHPTGVDTPPRQGCPACLPQMETATPWCLLSWVEVSPQKEVPPLFCC